MSYEYIVIDPDGDTLIRLPSPEKPYCSTASPRAKRVLQGPFIEAVPHADGLRHWKFDHIFDPEAFKIVMNIIHAHFKEIPDKVSLKMLSDITVIVDNLNCRASVHHFAKIWVVELIAYDDPDYEDVNKVGIYCNRKGAYEVSRAFLVFWAADPTLSSKSNEPTSTRHATERRK
ncbi:hypothetical protein TGAM01_v204561 [Trichoderma gamsii]|uniref:BTB domain-containing protein n=1 Tax=Trichoderma gamsii TaxID=398673 RepID=A0A2P4ZQK7_9HYPO|nr:hypothetical protein TGAM01_v204561 [Trichoderma gamsii]PON26551.1 hypothetical protein TGAM01_v204561 [Trichoderma gamsii]